MARKKNAPASIEAEGAVCLLPGDISANSVTPAQKQFLSRHGIVGQRAGLFASLIFGETSYG